MKKGFNLLEILISVAILSLLAVLSVGYFSGLKRAIALDGVIESVASLTREARTKTLAPEDASAFGIHFEESRAVLFKGTEFTEGNPDNKAYLVPSEAKIFNISFTGGNLVFRRLTGEPQEAGSVSIGLRVDTSSSKTLFINTAGLIYVE